ncbi:MAG: serine/threonine protein kinase [Planctomycetes bacterium]|nr:serine/threonine protein kinase [Planctomycetota bacterium]
MTEPVESTLETLMESFLARLRAGETPELEQLAGEHPEHASEIRELFPAIVAMERLKARREAESGGRASLGPHRLERLADLRLLREIGRGGMGIVYEAEQESLSRRVAVKVLPRQMLLDKNRLGRFLREAKIAARLHHTNIVPVFGTGEQDGYHYYVMQYIHGIGLDVLLARLRERRERHGDDGGEDALLAAATRALERDQPPGAHRWGHAVARIGVQVADALAHAHAQGTLHRDVKPGNLLLDARGTVFVTDFGLAKALEQDGITVSGDVVGTIQYIAPEQLHGRVDARADLYSLGLVLYELLTLEPAFPPGDRAQLLEAVRAGQIRPLRGLMPDVPRDLETIVQTAIAPDPAHRYRDAAALRDDLQRFLDDRPILARRTTALEQLGRWCRRNKLLAGLTTSTLLALLSAGAVGWVAYATTTGALEREGQRANEARRQGARAENNLLLALRAFEDVFDLVSGPDVLHSVPDDPEEGQSAALPSVSVSTKDVELLQRILRFYDLFIEQNADNQGLRRESAKAYRRTGDIRQRLGQLSGAEEAYRRSLTLYRQLLGSAHAGGVYALELALLHNELGRVLAATGRFGDARAEHEIARDLLAPVAGEGSQLPARLELARTWNLLGTTLTITRFRAATRDERPTTLPTSLEAHATALEILDALDEATRNDPQVRLLRARTLRLLAAGLLRNRVRGDARQEESRLAESKRRNEESVALLRGLVQEFPANDLYRYELVECLSLVSTAPFLPPRRGTPANSEERSAQLAEADTRLGEAVRLGEALLRERPLEPEYKAALLRALQRLAMVRDAQGRPAESVPLIERAVSLAAELQAQFPGVPAYQIEWFNAQGALVRSLERRNEIAPAVAALETLVAATRERLAQQPEPARLGLGFVLGRHLEQLERLLRQQGETAKADEVRRQLDELRRRR